MYDAKAKASMMKYKKEKREEVRLNVPKGTIAKYKAFAETRGMSMTALITSLMEAEMRESGFHAEWEKEQVAERKAAEAEETAKLAEIRAENAAAMLDSMK